MSMAIEYERLKTGIVDFNLSISEESTRGVRSGDSPSGFLVECYLGHEDNHHGTLDSNWHIHYRE